MNKITTNKPTSFLYSSGVLGSAPDFGQTTCSITRKIIISNCYSTDKLASKATVSVEVAWANAPSGSITISYAGQTQKITLGSYASGGGNGTKSYHSR